MFPGTDAATESINDLFFEQPMAVVSPDPQVSKIIWKEYTRIWQIDWHSNKFGLLHWKAPWKIMLRKQFVQFLFFRFSMLILSFIDVLFDANLGAFHRLPTGNLWNYEEIESAENRPNRELRPNGN